MFRISEPDGCLSAADVKDVATDVIGSLPLPEIEGRALDPGDIWPVVIFASVNQTSIWDICSDHDAAPCDDAVLTWLHTLDRTWCEVGANAVDSTGHDDPQPVRVEDRLCRLR
jgi:hypothetical protein